MKRHIKVICESLSYWDKTNGHSSHLARYTRTSDSAEALVLIDGKSNAESAAKVLGGGDWDGVFARQEWLPYREFARLKKGAAVSRRDYRRKSVGRDTVAKLVRREWRKAIGEGRT
tara:strand:+ start:2002 stop:2349 length:348 start_codon:yes stop_codon:yes gene_type:complete